MAPDWLPSQLSFTGSNLQADYDTLHEVFKKDFLNGDIFFVDELRIITDTSIDPNSPQGYTRGFTHLITIGNDTRSIDYDRAKKLPWIRAVIENYTQPEVQAFWVANPKGETLYLWLPDYDFVVILRRLKSKSQFKTGIIITAYHVQPYGKRDLQKLFGRASRVLQ